MAFKVVPTDERMIAANLSEHFGYNTYLIGKWHLGETDDSVPTARGFDESLSFLIGAMKYLNNEDPRVVNAVIENSPFDDLMRWVLPFAVSHNNKPKFQPRDYMTDFLSDEASNLIHTLAATPDANPFFLTLAYNAPHNPLQALLSDYNDPEIASIPTHNERVYAAMIKALDRGVGKVLQALRDTKQWENTIVFFTSDNGGATYINIPHVNHPFRGWKSTFFEGGLRVPLFMQWPERVSAALEVTEPVAHVDIFPTIIEAVRAVAAESSSPAIESTPPPSPPRKGKVNNAVRIPLAQRFLYLLEGGIAHIHNAKNYFSSDPALPPARVRNGANHSLSRYVLDGVSLLPIALQRNETLTSLSNRALYWRSGEYKAIVLAGW